MKELETVVIPLSDNVPTSFLRALIGMVEAHKDEIEAMMQEEQERSQTP